MIPCCVLIPMHPCISLDIHQVVVPPATPFPAPYFWLQILGGLPVVNKAQMGSKTYAWSFPAMQKGTDIGRFIVHVGNPANLKLPFIILGSGSKSPFGAGTVKIENKVVATACLIMINKNLNCDWPVKMPTGNVIAPNTVLAGMSLGDFVAGFINMGLDSALSFVVGKAFGEVGDKIGAKIVGQKTAESAWSFVVGETSNLLFGEGLDKGRSLLKNHAGMDSDTDQIGDWAGEGLDDSVEGTAIGDAEEAIGETLGSGVDAVGEYFNGTEEIGGSSGGEVSDYPEQNTPPQA